MKKVLFCLFVSMMATLNLPAQVGINTDGTPPNNSAMLDVKSSSKGLLPPRMTHEEIEAIVDPAAGLIVYCTDCASDGNGAFYGYINGAWNAILTCIPPIKPATGVHIPTDNQVTWKWNAVSGATGYRWGTSNVYTTATDMGNALQKVETGLVCNTPYTRYAWAYNACGSSFAVVLAQTTTYTAPTAPVAGTHLATPTQISWNWTSVPGATGYKWNTTNDYASATDMGTATSKTETGLTCNTPYTRYIWAYNACGNSTAVALSQTTAMNPAVSVSISASANPVCEGTAVTFTATPVNGGTTPAYQWKKNGTILSGATNATYTYTPVNNDAITCQLTSGTPCAQNNPGTSNTVTMSVTSMLVISVSVAASATSVCAGTSVSFTATPVNGGAAPAYQWKKNGTNISGATNATYAYSPANGDAINCLLTSSLTCVLSYQALSNTVTMTVNPILTAGVSIAASANPVCAGISVTFTATPANGGTAPAYQWKKGGTNITGATNATYIYAPVNADALTCVLTSNATCISGSPATSNTVTMTVNPLLPVTVNIAASDNPVCTGTSVTFTATPGNGGTTPAYQWKKGGTVITGATNATYSYVPVNADALTCVLTSNATCISGSPATSNTVTMTVNPLPVTPTAGTHVASETQIVWNWNTVSGATGYKWNTTNDYATAADMGTATTKTETGLTCNTAYTRYAWAYNACGNSSPVTLTQTTSACQVFSCGQLFNDSRDGKNYNTVVIGTQCWLAQNLNVGTRINGTVGQANNVVIEKYCYADNDDNCAVYGGLYQWDEMMNYTASSNTNPSGRQGICPDGWHLPSDLEWCQVESYLDATVFCTDPQWHGTDAGGKMKETGYDHWASPNQGATNASGFTGIGGGYKNSAGNFIDLNTLGAFWTTTEHSSTHSLYHDLASYSEQIYRSAFPKTSGFSARCIKD